MDDPSRREYIWRVAVFVAIVAAAYVAFLAIDVLLLVFGGILLAVFLRALSDPLARRTRLGPSFALTLVVILIFGLIGFGLWFVSPELTAQVEIFSEVLPAAIQEMRTLLQGSPLGELVLDSLEGTTGEGDFVGLFSGLLSLTAETIAYLLTVLFVGLFLAYNPGLYVGGAVRLVPTDHQEKASGLLQSLGHTMRWWLIGRAIAMTMVGVSTYLVLLIIGIPLAGLLGVIVGLLTFAPYLGPILGTVPIVLVSMMEGTMETIYVVALYAVVQHIEGYVIDPLIQQRVTYLPPAVTVAAQVLMGLLLGGLGIALATPLAAVAMVTTQKTYLAGRP